MTIDEITFDAAGLVPVCIVDAHTNKLLTLAYANREAIEKTIATKQTHLWSRSRNRLWRKGEESGNTQDVFEIVADCDGDSLMYRVNPHGPACHTGADSCFHDPVFAAPGEENAGAFMRAIDHLERTIASRRGADTRQSYVAKLFEGGVDRIGKKIGEEATELVIAAKNKDRKEIVWEAADLIFHTLVLLAEEGVTLDEIGGEFQRRSALTRESLEGLAGVGPTTARALREMGLSTPSDLLAHIPRDYKDWREPRSLAAIAADALSSSEPTEEIAVAHVTSVRDVRARIAITNVELRDESGSLRAVWYGRRGLDGKIRPGMRLFVHGRVAAKRRRGAVTIELNVMHHRVLDEDAAFTGEIVPIYPATKDVSTRTLRSIISRNLSRLLEGVEERLPDDIVRTHRLITARKAWHDIHVPKSPSDVAPARRRIIYEEFFAIALAAALVRAERKREGKAIPIQATPELLARFEESLPFRLTGAQSNVIAQILADMREPHAMNRLLQGDVGAGKTLVAAAAILAAASSGVQSALMAPTEILASQHAQKLAPLLLPFGVTLEAVFGSLSASARRTANDRIASGEALLAVGTHALLTESVEFKRLGLAIIDEQHRFGVEHRAALRAKGSDAIPHTLHMTATPIPRTLAQTRYADLDLSVIDELPPGRTPIATYVIRESRKPVVYEFVRKNVGRGQQAYVVAPAIELSDYENAPRVAAIDEAKRVSSEDLAGLRVDLLHGRMPPREKEAAMARFTRGETDVLIATTVVEVGVDVPNASVMVVLDAHRYGLAQLHQLRGRVGRGIARSFCVLVAPDDVAETRRLEILTQTEDGFRIAEEDLRLRKAGDMAGTQQAGAGSGTFGDLVQDFSVYLEAKREADRIVAGDPSLERPENRALRGLVETMPAARAMLISS